LGFTVQEPLFWYEQAPVAGLQLSSVHDVKSSHSTGSKRQVSGAVQLS